MLLLALAFATASPAIEVHDAISALAGTELFPSSLTVSTEARNGAVHVTLGDIPRDPVLDELRRETILGALLANKIDTPVFLNVGAPREPRLTSSNPAPPRRFGKGLNDDARFPFGAALSGFRIAISAGHGWLDNGDGTFRTQRSNHKFEGCAGCRGITEDFFSAELATNQVIPLLQQMGAEVILMREADHSIEDALIVDDGDAAYSETGAWTDGSTAGFGYLDDYRVNPDTDLGGAAFAIAPRSEQRRVSLRFADGANRTPGAVLNIVHDGGVRTLSLDQTRFGRFWFDVGAFTFANGGAVELAHGPSTGFLIADAIKVGGGLHPVSRNPWWQMSAQIYVAEAGAPGDVTFRNDVTIRPAYAEFVGPDIYISLHANASGTPGGSSAHGTSIYRYSCGVFGDHTSSVNATSCDDPPGSRDLLDEVHASVLAELRAAWDPGWADRGRLVADFGEVRELDDTPGILVETGFFDNLIRPAGVTMSDNQALHDPRWREAFAIGLARGVARFLAPGSDAPPARPDGVYAQNVDGGLRLSWNPVAGALGYRVVTSRLDRGGFDEGVVVEGDTSIVLDDLERGVAYAFRVSALDDNGEGYASQAVVARYKGEAAPVVVVWAYDRRDAWVQDVDNDLLAAIDHANAMPANVFFDGALDEALEDYASYTVVDFAAGKDSTEHEAVSAAQRQAIVALLDQGGRVILSGEEVGYALVEVGADTTFLRDNFSATYVSDDAETFVISGVGALADLSGGIDDGSARYEVVYPDVYQAEDGADAPMLYEDGSTALVLTDQTALVGFGLEALVDDSARAFVFRVILERIAPEVFEENAGEGEGEGEAGEGEGEGEAGEGEGEDVLIKPVSILTPPKNACGCASSTSSAPVFALALLVLLRRRIAT